MTVVHFIVVVGAWRESTELHTTNARHHDQMVASDED
jgi:hypothetical protein